MTEPEPGSKAARAGVNALLFLFNIFLELTKKKEFVMIIQVWFYSEFCI